MYVPGTAVEANPFLPAGAIAIDFPRLGSTLANSALIISGRLHVVGLDVPAGKLITSITFMSGTQAAVTPTNQWFCALDPTTRAVLGLTADDTTTAWNASTAKTLTLASPFVTTRRGLLIGINVVAGTVPSLLAVVSTQAANLVTPVPNGFSTTGLTNPASLPNPAGAIAGQAAMPLCWVS